ncbi:hypothetical protein M9H77_08545 [Catharanthus roseus]|uniref:Uncharacterized protein n=1 Tax=Catharanthus roseus TaxID=4058 RepID=A0ACC0BY94_CATRO|nr:hypothetical protein M9H77_08545 [Catharanthus roseus]
MSRLVAKQSKTSFLSINKGLPKVERSFRRHSSSKQFEHFLAVFLAFFLLKIKEAPAALKSINHPQSPFDLRRSFQALKSTLCRREKSEDYPTYQEFPRDFVTATIS